MHLMWKNCPTAWQGSYNGKEKKPSIVLESVCDFNLWVWHCFFGSGGSFNDLSVLDASNLLEMMLDGTLARLERESGTVPYKIAEEEFDKLFLLVDGIYPKYSRFVQGIKDPLTPIDSDYTGWQEGARKDIERAFGVLQVRYKWTARPVELHKLEDITRRMKTCLMLHNMGVSDRVMENNVHVRYDPCFGVEEDVVEALIAERNHPKDVDVEKARENLVNQVDDPELIQNRWNEPEAVEQKAVDWGNRWLELTNEAEHFRLRHALKIAKERT